MRKRWFGSLSLLSFAAMALPNVAAADVFNLDEFAVTNNGTQIFDDSFGEISQSGRRIGDRLALGNHFRQRQTGELLR